MESPADDIVAKCNEIVDIPETTSIDPIDKKIIVLLIYW